MTDHIVPANALWPESRATLPFVRVIPSGKEEVPCYGKFDYSANFLIFLNTSKKLRKTIVLEIENRIGTFQKYKVANCGYVCIY